MLIACGCGGLLEQLTGLLASVDLSALVSWALSWLRTGE